MQDTWFLWFMLLRLELIKLSYLDSYLQNHFLRKELLALLQHKFTVSIGQAVIIDLADISETSTDFFLSKL